LEEYKTITTEARGLLKEKGSKFIAIARPVLNIDEAKSALAEIKKEFHDARHHCYAYRLTPDADEFRFNDDGEPSGTAGKPIYGQIISYDLHYILIVVVRYFGGVLLGTGGLIQAYKGAAKDALEHAEICTRPIEVTCGISFEYPAMNDVMKLIKDEEIIILSQEFNLNGKMELLVQKARWNAVLQKLSDIEQLTLTLRPPVNKF